MPVKVPTIDDLESLVAPLAHIFSQTQASTANHRKNIVHLRKIQDACAQVTTPRSKGGPPRLTGEKAFVEAFCACLERVLPVKKGIVVADRVVKFVASFVAAVSPMGNEGEDENEDEEEETTGSRFYTDVLNFLLPGFAAKDKNVRFRCCQLVAAMLRNMPDLDEDLFSSLRSSILLRVRDKDAHVRVQAVIALSAFLAAEPSDEDEEDVTEVLMEIMATDPAAEVRQTALLMLPSTKQTFPAMILRTRDVDPVLRRNVYLGALSLAQIGDPRHLSIAQREELVKCGLGDRDDRVRRAAAGMISSWVDKAGSLDEFLARFDVVTSEEAEKALLSTFATRPDFLDSVDLDGDFWTDLTPEKALLARVFVSHCRETKDEDRLEQSLPVVTFLAFHIQAQFDSLITLFEDVEDPNIDDDELRAKEQAIIEKEFIIKEMMKLAVDLDYSDETGRRKMWGLAREMITHLDLPALVIPYNLDVLRKLSDTESDLIHVLVEVVHEIRDTVLDRDSPPSATTPAAVSASDEGTVASADLAAIDRPIDRAVKKMSLGGKAADAEESALKRAVVDLRSLDILKGLLERVNGTLQENSVLHGLLSELVVPSIRGKQPELRERGIICLGLVCLIDQKTASNAFSTLFVSQVENAHGELKIQVLQIVFDLLMVYDMSILSPQAEDPKSKLAEYVLYYLDQTDDLALATAVEGAAKLMLAGKVDDDEVLRLLIQLYVWPDTKMNAALRQCLSYFFPVFCYSSAVNQRRMQRIFLSTLAKLIEDAEDLDEDQELVGPNKIAHLFLEWTDPQRAVRLDDRAGDWAVQVDMAVEILKALFDDKWANERKMLAQLLAKLYIPEEVDDVKLRWILTLITKLKDKNLMPDSVARNALTKFETSLRKKFPDQLKSWTDGGQTALAGMLERLSLEELEFWEEVAPKEDGEADTVADANDEPTPEDAEVAASPAVIKKAKRSLKAGKWSVSTSGRRSNVSTAASTARGGSADEEEENDDDMAAAVTSTPKIRKKPASKHASPAPSTPATAVDVDEEESSDDEATPAGRRTSAPTSKARISFTSTTEESTIVEDDDGDSLLGTEDGEDNASESEEEAPPVRATVKGSKQRVVDSDNSDLDDLGGLDDSLMVDDDDESD